MADPLLTLPFSCSLKMTFDTSFFLLSTRCSTACDVSFYTATVITQPDSALPITHINETSTTLHNIHLTAFFPGQPGQAGNTHTNVNVTNYASYLNATVCQSILTTDKQNGMTIRLTLCESDTKKNLMEYIQSCFQSIYRASVAMQCG